MHDNEGVTTPRVKRLLDVTLASTGLVLAAPVMAVIALMILATMGRPIFFRQMRPGYLGTPFRLVKFRTMREAVGRDGLPLPTVERLTRLGHALRRTSLDELPELWSILKGDMSLVGPRPLLMEYLDRYSPEQMRRHDVKPGLTGLAQISGRHLLEWDERFKLDVWYVDHCSLRLDARILKATFAKVLKGSGLPPGFTGDYVFTGSEGAAERTIDSAPGPADTPRNPET